MTSKKDAPQNSTPPLAASAAVPSRSASASGGGEVRPLLGLILTPDRNTTKPDYKGAFQPEAIHFSRLHGLPRATEIDITRGAGERRAAVFAAIEKMPHDSDVFACFTHGLRRALPQFGFDNSHAVEFGRALASRLAPSGVVALYACSTGTSPNGIGEGDGGFADALRDAIVQASPAWRGHVDAHERAAHTTTNPYVRRMDYTTDKGGAWIVEPDSALWVKWRTRLNERDPLRLRFPFMTIAEIHESLA